MLANSQGRFDFLPGTDFLSFAAIAKPGFAIERVVLRNPHPAETAFARVERHMAHIGRPMAALCGLEYRQYLARQLTGEEFGTFNSNHVKNLTAANLMVDGHVPVARTNVVLNTGEEKAGGYLSAFSYTVPSERAGPGNFVFAAIPEVRFTSAGFEVIAAGETSPEALESKLDFILDAASRRLAEIGASWADVTGSQLYCEANLHPFLKSKMLAAMGEGGWRGIQWHHSLPPVGPAIIELDFRSVRADLILD